MTVEAMIPERPCHTISGEEHIPSGFRKWNVATFGPMDAVPFLFRFLGMNPAIRAQTLGAGQLLGIGAA